MHLELDPRVDEPLAHLALGPARAPHAVRGDRAVAVARPRVVRLADLRERAGHLARPPLRIVRPQPFEPLVHRGRAGAGHIRMQLVHPSHVRGLVLVRSRGLVGPHAQRGAAIPFGALGAVGELAHRLSPSLALLLADHRRRDQLGHADFHVRHRRVAIGGQEPVLRGGAHLAAALAAQLVDELAAGLHDPLHLVGADLPVGPHRHDLRHAAGAPPSRAACGCRRAGSRGFVRTSTC